MKRDIVGGTPGREAAMPLYQGIRGIRAAIMSGRSTCQKI